MKIEWDVMMSDWKEIYDESMAKAKTEEDLERRSQYMQVATRAQANMVLLERYQQQSGEDLTYRVVHFDPDETVN